MGQEKYAYNDFVNRSTGQSPFEILYGCHPRGILELRDLSSMDNRSAQGENFAKNMKEIHEQVKKTLQQNNEKYKTQANKIRRDVHYKVGDLVMAYLRKERLPKGQPRKLCMKNIGPLKVVHKYGNNTYEVELPPNLGISPIFNVCYFFQYKGNQSVVNEEESIATEDVYWIQDLPPNQPMTLD